MGKWSDVIEIIVIPPISATIAFFCGKVRGGAATYNSVAAGAIYGSDAAVTVSAWSRCS